MDFIALIPPARALLGWSQTDLAEKTGLGQTSIANIENRKSAPHQTSIDSIRAALEKEGIEFLPAGVQMRKTPVYFLEGPEWYLDLLNDALSAMPEEIIIENVDDRKSTPPVLDKLRELHRAGIKMRMTTMEGNTYLTAPSSYYRFIPKDFFKNWVVMIYGDKVAVSIANETACMVVSDPHLADAMRSNFDLLWHILPQLSVKSTAQASI